MKNFIDIENEPEVIKFILENEKLLFGDIINGDTQDRAIDILAQVYAATKDGCTAGTEEGLDYDFFYSHNGDNELLQNFSCRELCGIMGINPILGDEEDYAPTPYCNCCGVMSKSKCHCLPYAE